VAWADADGVYASLADRIHCDGGQVGDFWLGIIADSLEDAQADVEAEFLAAGLTVADAAASRQTRALHRRQTLYWCGVNGRAYLSDAAATNLDKLDIRGTLSGVTFTDADGNRLVPASGSGLVAAGVLAARTCPLPPALRAAFGRRPCGP
jgi:hypothetical protein